jgi:hypothetical protein
LPLLITVAILTVTIAHTILWTGFVKAFNKALYIYKSLFLRMQIY